ncbi:MAG: hypothetical protein LBL34_05125 [Clostridiales bacterium]|jgi:hypothetical protein|nr:hypothetical protein [Clostridiales bacterium]
MSDFPKKLKNTIKSAKTALFSRKNAKLKLSRELSQSMFDKLPPDGQKELRENAVSAGNKMRKRSKFHLTIALSAVPLNVFSAIAEIYTFPYLQRFSDFLKNLPGSLVPFAKNLPAMTNELFILAKDMADIPYLFTNTYIISSSVAALGLGLFARSKIKQRNYSKIAHALESHDFEKLPLSQNKHVQKMIQAPEPDRSFEAMLMGFLLSFCLTIPVINIANIDLTHATEIMRDIGVYNQLVQEQAESLQHENTDTHSLLTAAMENLENYGLQLNPTDGEYKKFVYDLDDPNTRDIRGYYGVDLLDGRGVCRHLTAYFVDLLKDFDIKSQTVPLTLGDREALTAEDDIAILKGEPMSHGVARGEVNHSIVRIPDFTIRDDETGGVHRFKDVYYDPTNDMYAVQISSKLVRFLTPYAKYQDSPLASDFRLETTYTHNAFNFPAEESAHIYSTNEYMKLLDILKQKKDYRPEDSLLYGERMLAAEIAKLKDLTEKLEILLAQSEKSKGSLPRIETPTPVLPENEKSQIAPNIVESAPESTVSLKSALEKSAEKNKSTPGSQTSPSNAPHLPQKPLPPR